MAITYPLAFPSHTKSLVSLSWEINDGKSESPFDFSSQVQKFGGNRWSATCSLPKMRRTDAEQWNGFLLSLSGLSGTFLMGDTMGQTARGALGGTPVVNGADQTGSELSINGCSASVTGWVKTGDYIQLGTGSSSRLHKVLQDADSNGSGEVSVDIWPPLRSSPADGSVVVTSGAVGVWRLASGTGGWDVDSLALYGITFACVEAL